MLEVFGMAESLFDMLRCIACRKPAGIEPLCRSCRQSLIRHAGCGRCGQMGCPGELDATAAMGAEETIRPTAASPYGKRPCLSGSIDRFFASYSYEGPARSMVVELKKTGSPRVAAFCTKELAGGLWGLVEEGWLVSWIPSASSSEKGFDHGEVLARAVSWHLGLAAERLLVRKVPGEAKSLGSRARRHLAKAAIDVVPARKLGSYHGILLIDDVATTGASLVAAADRLKAAGVRSVVAATVTHTPLYRREKKLHWLA